MGVPAEKPAEAAGLELTPQEKPEFKNLVALYGAEIATRIYSLQTVDDETWKDDEMKYLVALKSCNEFRKKVVSFLEKAEPADSFRSNLQRLWDRYSAETKQDSTQSRRGLLEEMLASSRMALRTSKQNQDTGKAEAKVEPASTGGQGPQGTTGTPPVTLDTASGQPRQAGVAPGTTPNIPGASAGTPGTNPPAPGTKSGEASDKDKKFKEELRAIRNMGTGDLIAELVKTGIDLVGGGKDLFSSNVNKAIGKISDDDKKKIKYDPEKNKDAKYKNQDESFKYVTEAIGLDAAKYKVANVPQLLTLLRQNYDFVTDRGKIKEAKVGDIIFFARKNDKNEDVAYLTGVISKTEPLTIKTIPGNDSNPVEMELEKSDYFKNDWYGFIKMPQPENTQPAGAKKGPTPDAKPADSPARDDTATKPADTPPKDDTAAPAVTGKEEKGL
jgi:hypothetical protein